MCALFVFFHILFFLVFAAVIVVFASSHYVRSPLCLRRFFFGCIFFFVSVSCISFGWAAPVELNAKICEHRVAHPTVSLLGFVDLDWRHRHCHCHSRCSCRRCVGFVFCLAGNCITCCYRFVFILAARTPNPTLFTLGRQKSGANDEKYKQDI